MVAQEYPNSDQHKISITKTLFSIECNFEEGHHANGIDGRNEQTDG